MAKRKSDRLIKKSRPPQVEATQLELSLSPRSAEIYSFSARSRTEPKSSSEATKRLLEFAASLPHS